MTQPRPPEGHEAARYGEDHKSYVTHQDALLPGWTKHGLAYLRDGAPTGAAYARWEAFGRDPCDEWPVVILRQSGGQIAEVLA